MRPVQPPSQHPNRSPPKTPRLTDGRDRFHLIVDCRNEHTQKQLYGQLTAQGLKCRVLVL